MNDQRWMPILVVASFVAVLGLILFLAWRGQRSARTRGQLRRVRWLLLVMLGIVAFGSFRSTPPPRRWLPAAIPAALVAVLVGLSVFGGDRLTPRVAKLCNEGKVDEAHALVRRAMERRPPVEPADPPPSPLGASTADADPWAPPRARGGRVDHRSANLLNLMGVVELNRGNCAEAIDLYRRAEKVAGAGPILSANIGLALTRLGRVEEGLAMVRDAIATLPESEPIDRSVLETLLADRLIDLGRLPDAHACLDSAGRQVEEIRGVSKSARKPLLDQIAETRAKLEAAEAAPAEPA